VGVLIGLSVAFRRDPAITADATSLDHGKSSRERKSFRGAHKAKPREHRSAVANCAQEVALIADYVSCQMTAANRAAFEMHVNACKDCAAFLQTYKKTIELTRSFLRTQPALQRPRNLTSRI